jgi:hypothetical protein
MEEINNFWNDILAIRELFDARVGPYLDVASLA